jgi:HD superfamily phosphohydrolase YqeK
MVTVSVNRVRYTLCMPDTLHYSNLNAHTPNEMGEWHRLDVHLTRVAELAQGFARSFGASDMARLVGFLHDVGKASSEFQAYLAHVLAANS